MEKIMNYQDIYTQYMYSYPHKNAYEFTERLDISSYRNSFLNKDMSLYIHIPFCKSKCGYCNLFSITNVKSDNYKLYIDAIKRHSNQMKSEINFESTNFNSFIMGGGTPLILPEKLLENLFDFCKNEYNFDFKNIFSVIESSPTQISKYKLNLLRDYNWKRLSVGVQSFVEEELRTMERFESVREVYTALEKTKKYDFEVLNIDLIYGTPNQTRESFLYSIKQALEFEPEEIFLYPLYKQKNAGLYGKFEIDRKLQYYLYEAGRDYLLEKGYRQLSMRSFAKKYECKADCGFENTLSLGCGGRSYFENLHFCEKYVANKKACEAEYISYIQKTDFLRDISYFILDEDELKRKFVIKNLFYITGLSLTNYERHFKSNFFNDFKFVENLMEKNYVHRKKDRIYLTEVGISLSDMIGPMFISDRVREKML